MQVAVKSLDYIIDTVSASHPLEPLLSLLKVNGKLVVVGLPKKPIQFAAPAVVMCKSFLPFFSFLLQKKEKEN